MKLKIMFLVFMIANLFNQIARGCTLGYSNYTIRVINNLPQNSAPLKLHCASGDDELGNHNLNAGGEFSWNFCKSPFGNTLYFCHVWWGTKLQRSFDVFNYDFDFETNTNTWIARKDGIFFTEVPQFESNPKSVYQLYTWALAT